MSMKLLGMNGSMQRMRELQAKVDTLTPRKQNEINKPANEVLPNPSRLPNKMFSEILDGGFTPLSPDAPGLSTLINRAPSSLLPLIQNAAEKAGIDPALFEALVNRESSFQTDAVSIAGAKGLAQLMERTAASLGVTDIFDSEQNLDAGARYLAQMLKQFDGDTELALGAYNAGPGTVGQVGGVPRESMQYVKDVIRMAGEIRGN